jgi:hypothetical protein
MHCQWQYKKTYILNFIQINASGFCKKKKQNQAFTVKPAHVVTSIKSNLPMWSPLLSQTCPCGHLY